MSDTAWGTINIVKAAPLAYLATPYTKYKGGDIERAFVDAAKLAARLMTAGVKVYSPIAHTHPLAIHGKIDPLDHMIWMPFDEAMMSAAQVLIVATMDGWDRSKGVLHEIEFFHARNKPIFGCNPETLGMWRIHLIEATNLIHELREKQQHSGTLTAHADNADRSALVKQI